MSFLFTYLGDLCASVFLIRTTFDIETLSPPATYNQPLSQIRFRFVFLRVLDPDSRNAKGKAMLSDKVHVRLQATGGSLTFVEVWIVDEPGPWNSWNQEGLPGPWLGPGSGKAWVDGKENTSTLFGGDSASSIASLHKLPYPGECKKGDNGLGSWGKGAPIGSGIPLLWSVIDVET